MKLTVGTMLAVVTLIGSILIGGSNFGSLRADATNNAVNILEQRIALEAMQLDSRDYQRETAITLATMSKELAVLVEIMKRVENRRREK